MCIIDYIMYRAYMGMLHRKGELREIGAHRYTLLVIVCLFSPLYFLLTTPFQPKDYDTGLYVNLVIFLIILVIFEINYKKKKIEHIKKRFSNSKYKAFMGRYFLITLLIVSIVFSCLSVSCIHVISEKYQLNGIFYRLIGISI